MESFAEWFSKKTVGGFVPPIPETPQYETPELPEPEEEGEEPKKALSFSEWFSKKAGKPSISGPGGIPPTPLAAPPEKTPPWGSLARGARVPGTLQTPPSPQALIAGTGAPGEIMPSAQMFQAMPPEEQAVWKRWHEKTAAPELRPEIAGAPPSAQRIFQKKQKMLRALEEGKTGAELAKEIVATQTRNKMGMVGLPDVPIFGGEAYTPSIVEKISDKIATGQDLRPIESIANRALMLSSGLVNGYTGGIFLEAAKEQMLPQDVIDEMLYMGGHLGGMISNFAYGKGNVKLGVPRPRVQSFPSQIGKTVSENITKPVINEIGKLIKIGPATRAWLNDLIGSSTGFGAMMTATDLTVSPEELAKTGLQNTILGAIFRGTALLDFFKTPFLNKMVRNVSSRALANLTGSYKPEIITALAEDPKRALPAVIDELFMSWFSNPGKNPKTTMKEWHQAQGELGKLRAEYGDELIKTSPEMKRIISNLKDSQDLAFHPGTGPRQNALQQQNEQLIQMYRGRHALVPVTPGRVFEAGPGGKIIPPGETPERIAARQRLEERHEQQRQAQGLAARTAEVEKERQAMLPVPVPGEPEPGFYMGMRGEVPKEIALEPEGKRMKRELIAERQLEARQRKIEEDLAKVRPAEKAPEAPQPPEPAALPKPIPEKAKPIVPPKVPKAEVAVVKGKPIAAKAEIKIPAGVKPEAPTAAPVLKPIAPAPKLVPKPAPKPALAPLKAGLEAKVPGVFGRHVPPGEYVLRGNFLYKGKRAVLDLNVMAKDVVYKLRDAKRRVAEGTLQPEGYDKLKKGYMAEAVKAYEGMKPWKEFPKPAEVYKAREARIAKEREVVDRAIKSKALVPEVVKPFTEEAAKSERANALQAHFDARDSQSKAILEILFPREKRAISRLGLGSKARLPEGGKIPRIEYAGKVRKGPGFGLSVEHVKKDSWLDEKDLAELEKIFPGKFGKGAKPSEIEFATKEELGKRGAMEHGGEEIGSYEETLRKQRFYLLDVGTGRYKNIGKSLDRPVGKNEVKVAINNYGENKNKVAWFDAGENVHLPADSIRNKVNADIPKLGLSIQKVAPRSLEDLELDRALAESRIPGTDIKMPKAPRELDPATNFLINSDKIVSREQHWRPGATVIENVRRMGQPGKMIAKAMDNFVYQQNAHTSRDQMIGSSAVRMIGHSMKKGGELKDVSFLHRGKKIGKRLIDLVENKVQPANEYETAAKGLVKELFKGIANDAEALGMKITTAFGREIPWAERENYFPQVWKKDGLEKFLDSETTPFRHLRTIYLEHLSKAHFPDVYKTDPAEALRRMELKWRDLRRDLKAKPFSNLEMSRILDEGVLQKLQAKWTEMRPGEAFPLERDTGTHVLMNYLAGAQTRIAWMRNFGKDVLEKGSFRPELIDRLVPEMKNEANYKYTMNFFHQYLTRSGFDTKTTRLLRATRTAQLWKLGTAFIPNSTQWFTNVMPLVSTKTGLAGFIDTARVIAGNKELKEFFVKSGARTMKSALREAMMDDQSKLNGFADLMLKVHLFNGTEYFNALEAAMTGRRKAMEISGKLSKRPEAYRAPQWERELRKLGLEDADIAKIKGGKALAGAEEPIFRAMFEMRKQTQFLSDAFHLPKLWSHPVGRLATQFKNFAYNQTRLLLTEPLAESWKFAKTWGREGDLSKLVKAMIILPAAGAAVTKAKEETYKLLGIHFYENLLAGKSWPFKYLIYMANAGALGIVADSIGALAFGSKGITQLMGGPTFSDIAGVLEATGKSMNEVWTAVKNKNPGWLAHRGKAIGEYWLRVGERISPDARILIQNLFQEWKAAKAAINWSQVYRNATKTYKETYKLKGQYEANQFWDAWMATQGREYNELFSKTPDKPTEKEIDEWWEEQGKPTVERLHLPGKNETQPEGGPAYLW